MGTKSYLIMLSLCFILTIFINMQTCLASSVESDNSLPNYDFDLPIKTDLEKQLRNKFAQKKKSDEKLRKLKEHLAKDSEYFEDILHFAVNSSKNIKDKEENVQNDFRRVIGMVGVKYTYKRDSHWRTWREITYPNKKREVLCYRCQNSIEIAKSNCNHGGYWVIEENRPLCSYEIFSFKNKNELCAAYFWQLNKAQLSSCPTVISYEQLAHCDIPIITNFLITRDYSKNVSERALPGICQGRENCVLTTVYNVISESIIFRIINTTNNIIYSRIMKHSGENYACFNDCGQFDFNTKTATRNDDHLILNLLKPIKKKRHNHIPMLQKYRKNKKGNNIAKDAFKHDKLKNEFKKYNLFENKMEYILEQPLHRERSTATCKPSMCKQLMNDLNYENLED